MKQMTNRAGFTIIELLVASMLLGMLFSILTMVFNQSSIAWRTGDAIVTDLKDVRANIAEAQYQSDNLYLWQNQPCYLVGLWKDDGTLRTRTCTGGLSTESYQPLNGVNVNLGVTEFDLDQLPASVPVGGSAGNAAYKTYIINVKSDGPDLTANTYDDIWSYPDEITE